MLIAIGRNLLIVSLAMVVVGVSAAIWPIDAAGPEHELTRAGAHFTHVFDGTLLIGAALEGAEYNDDMVVIASKIPSLRRLSLAGSRVTRRGIKSLQTLERLSYLNLRRTRMTADAVDDIARISSLKELSLEGCDWLTDEHLAKLAALPNLQDLNLASTSIGTSAFEHLERFPALKCLVLHRCRQIDDTAVDALIRFSRARSVRLALSWTEITLDGLSRLRAGLPAISVEMRPETITGLRSVGERGLFMTDASGEIIGFRYRRDAAGWVAELQPGDMSVVSSLPSMKRLSLEQTNVTDEVLLESSPLPQLEILRLSATLVSDDGLRVLERFPNVKLLHLSNVDIQGTGLENLPATVPRLETLKVKTKLGDEILQHITGLSELRALSIDAPVTDAGMKQLCKLEKLESLELIQTQVRSPGIKILSRARALKELAIEEGPMDDSDVEALVELTSVNHIVLSHTQVTRAGKNRFMRLAPAKNLVWTDAGYVLTELFR